MREDLQGLMKRGGIVEARRLTRRFGDLTAVDGLDLRVAAGEIFGLVGPDGAGKTTTLRMLTGLLDPTDGGASVAGFDIREDPTSVRDHIGYMTQRFGLYPDLSVNENLRFYSDLFGVSGFDYHERVPRLLHMTRMEPFRDRLAGQLSGGMKQKLSLMCALLHQPEVLFLDEPTNGVDPISRRDFWAILYQLVKAGMTVVVTTAYLDEAERCNRVGLMSEGKLVECDTPESLISRLKEELYEISCEQRNKAREVLAQQPGVASVEPLGRTLHLFLSPQVTSAETLESLLRKEGWRSVRFKRISPSLEDVFIFLSERPRSEAQ